MLNLFLAGTWKNRVVFTSFSEHGQSYTLEVGGISMSAFKFAKFVSDYLRWPCCDIVNTVQQVHYMDCVGNQVISEAYPVYSL